MVSEEDNGQEITEFQKLQNEKDAVEERMDEYRDKMRNEAFDRFYDDKVLSTSEFFMVDDMVRCYSGHFTGFPEIAKDLKEIGRVLRIPVISKKVENPVKVVEQVTFNADSQQNTLMIGSQVKLPYFRQLVKEHGIKINISGLDKKIADSGRSHDIHTLKKFREFLIMADATTSMPMSKVPGMELFLEKEQDYAYKFNEAYVSALATAKEKYPNAEFELTSPIELMNDMSKLVFFLLGRSIRELVTEESEMRNSGRY